MKLSGGFRRIPGWGWSAARSGVWLTARLVLAMFLLSLGAAGERPAGKTVSRRCGSAFAGTGGFAAGGRSCAAGGRGVNVRDAGAGEAASFLSGRTCPVFKSNLANPPWERSKAGGTRDAALSAGGAVWGNCWPGFSCIAFAMDRKRRCAPGLNGTSRSGQNPVAAGWGLVRSYLILAPHRVHRMYPSFFLTWLSKSLSFVLQLGQRMVKSIMPPWRFGRALGKFSGKAHFLKYSLCGREGQ